jgi:stearoyl-CoA desaturase (Delta-9 desaturase)
MTAVLAVGKLRDVSPTAAQVPASDDASQTRGRDGDSSSSSFDADSPLAGGAQPISYNNIDRILTGAITVLPMLLLGVVAWQMWNRELHWRDIAIFAVMYVPCGLGVTVGFHRLLTHRSFKTSKWLRALFAICGTMAIEGPVIDWVTHHRQHHAYSDKPGDPHSPHVGHGEGWRGALAGLAHAHLGWLFERVQRGSRDRYAPDLLADPMIRFIDRTFIFWSLLGLAIPFGLGWLLGGTLGAALTGLIWGGAVRMFVLHHVTYSINSLCHFFGRRRFETSDHSRNLMWLAPLSLGESWHNNHHAFPTSAFHGMRRHEIDLSGLLIAGLERLGLVWDVQRIGSARQAAKALV